MPWIGPDARNALFYDSVADMKLGKNFDGSTVITNGYYKPNDGGGGTYIVRAKKETDVDDGGSIHFLMDDLVAELIVGDYVTPEQFGAYGDGVHDDTQAIQNALNSSSCVVALAKKYVIFSTLNIPSYKIFKGSGREKTEIHYTGDGTAIKLADRNIVMKDFLLSSKYSNEDKSTLPETLIGISTDRTTGFHIYRIDILSFHYAMYLHTAYLGRLESIIAYTSVVGFKLNDTSSSTESTTSIAMINLYANKCTRGYELHRVAYSTLLSCAADWCDIAYYFSVCHMNVTGCGCETPRIAIYVDGISSVITFNDFFCYNGTEPTGLIQLISSYRNFEDRQKVLFNGLALTHSLSADKITGFIKSTGDVQCHVNNYVADPFTPILVPLFTSYTAEYISVEPMKNVKELPTKGTVLAGQKFEKRNMVKGESMGWIVTRAGGCYKEEYDSSHSYSVGDQVSNGNPVYVCIKENDSSDPKQPGVDNDYWKHIAIVYAKYAELPLLP